MPDLSAVQGGLPHPVDSEWSGRPLGAIVQKLLADHQRWREQVLPSISSQLNARIRREKQESSIALRQVFVRLCRELDEHLKEEETVLFPAVLEMDQRARESLPAARPAFGSVRNPIVMIQRDHEDDAELWDTLQHLAQLDATAEGASESARDLYQTLTLFADDVRAHTAIESTILFPRAVELEKQVTGRA